MEKQIKLIYHAPNKFDAMYCKTTNGKYNLLKHLFDIKRIDKSISPVNLWKKRLAELNRVTIDEIDIAISLDEGATQFAKLLESEG